MRILYACEDNEVIWAIDEVVYGLYAIDKQTFHTRCVMDFTMLFRYGKFKPYGLVNWKEKYIVIIPFEIHKKWVIYNKTNGQIEYRQIIGEKGNCSFIGICGSRKQAYFCPYYVKDPIVVVDFNNLSCSQMIRNWNVGVPIKNVEVAWKGMYNEKYIFFPLRGTRILVRMNLEDLNIEFIKLNILEKIADIDGRFEELWILPMEGNKVYQIDENGEIIDYIEIKRIGQEVSASEFVRIIVQKRYIFLLPWRYQGIWVCEKSKKQVHIIGEKNATLSETYKTQNFRYYGYYLEKNKICFLPWQNKYMCVDLDSLVYEQRDISYPTAWTEEEYEYGYNWNLSLKYDSCFQEKEKCAFKIFLEFIKEKEDELSSNNIKSFGEKLWKVL